MDFNGFSINQSFRCKELCIKNSTGNYQTNEVPFRTLMDVAELVYNAIPEADRNKNQVIGIVVSKSSLLVTGIIGIIKSGNAFAIFDPASIEYHEKQFERFKISLAFFEPIKEFEGQRRFQDIGPFYVAKFKNYDNGNVFKMKIFYAIQTSGSLGEPKIVHVPYSAIIPNLLDFREQFSIDNLSSIFFGTSTTFDPSIVELLLAMLAGAELLIPKFDWICAIFEEILHRERISFLQITPAVLKRLQSSILRNIFGPESNVNFLLIGGENFPLNLVKQYLNESTRTKIYNVYGITEVSCWASYFEIEHKNIKKLRNGGRVPIGKPILNTKFTISNEGILLINGRKCFINFKHEEGPTSTGDIVYKNEKSEFEQNAAEICVESRFKPNSQLPSTALENEIMNLFPEIVTSKLIFIENCRFLFLDYFDGKSTITAQKIKLIIPMSLWPTRIFWNILRNPVFITQNGKINEFELEKFIRSKYGTVLLEEFMQQNYGIPVFDKTILSTSLWNLGIGSIEAAEITFLLTNSTNNPKFDGIKIMQFILDERNTLGEFFDKFGAREKWNFQKDLFQNDQIINLLEEANSNFIVEEKWRNCLGKCIDGTPVYSKGIIYVASHSGILKGISVRSGEVFFQYFSENDRFEAGCAVNEEYIAIGGFAGKMFVFAKSNGNLPKCIVECTSEIRMAPIFDGEDVLYWGEYSGNVWRLQMSKNSPVLINLMNCGFLRSSPLLYSSTLIFGTLDGVLVCLEKNIGQILWKHKMDSPIFASPIQFEQNDCFALSVKGELNLINLEHGKLIDSLNLAKFGSSFFDSPTLINDNFLLISASKNHLLLIGNKPKLEFLKQIRFPESASITRKPILFHNNLFVLNIEGTLFTFPVQTLFNSSNESSSFANFLVKLDAKTFGHPLILKEEKGDSIEKGKSVVTDFSITIGTRADFLHCFGVTTRRHNSALHDHQNAQQRAATEGKGNEDEEAG